MRNKVENICIGPMKWKQPISKLTKDDYYLPETLDNGICRICGEVPKIEEIKLKCILCGEDITDDMVACGIGHICYNCWDELKENKKDGQEVLL